MRIGFRTGSVTVVVYLRQGWSVEVWLGRFGFYSGPHVLVAGEPPVESLRRPSWERGRVMAFTRKGYIEFDG